jgi:predicted metal-dependent enzyme (double-stranded beta helix superfamily)
MTTLPFPPSTTGRLSADELSTLLKPLAEDPALWRLLAQYGAEGRWWRRLHHSDDIDIWLLTWLTGHSTDLHDHGGSAGAFAVVQGSLTEVRVSPSTAVQPAAMHRTVAAGQAVAVPATTVHDVYNASSEPAISLHAYSPPLSTMSFYAIGSDGLTRLKTRETREASRDAA